MAVQYIYDREPIRREPPPKRAAVLSFIQSEIDAGRSFPTYRAIAARMGWKNEGSARDCLCALAGDGQIKRVYTKKALKWELLP